MKIEKILVPVVGTSLDDEVLEVACQVARQNHAAILISYVIEIERALPLESENIRQVQRAEEILDRAEKIARQHWNQVESDLLQARAAGPALVDEASERGVDLILIGVPFRKKLGEFHLGSTPNYVMKNAPCRVLLWRQPADNPLDSKKK